METTRATDAFPWIYRFMLTTLEPMFALFGAAQVLFKPSDYLDVLTRESATFEPQTTFLYTELAGAWLVFAFNEAVILRMLDDRRVWTYLCFGMMLSDVLYCHSCAQALGGWTQWIRITDWTAMDWVVFATTAPPVLTRALILMGFGVRKSHFKVA